MKQTLYAGLGTSMNVSESNAILSYMRVFMFFYVLGIVSNIGQFPNAENEAQTFLSTGPMCRYACDLGPMLKVMAGPGGVDDLKLDDKVAIFFYVGLLKGAHWTTHEWKLCYAL